MRAGTFGSMSRGPHCTAWPAERHAHGKSGSPARRCRANVVAEALPFRDLGPSSAGGGSGILLVMDADSSALEQLPRDECVRLMGSVPVGRIVYTRRALPAVERTGWSVTIVGQARAVTDGAEIRRLERAAPPSWVIRQSDYFVSISPAMVNGRRVIGQRLTGGTSARRF